MTQKRDMATDHLSNLDRLDYLDLPGAQAPPRVVPNPAPPVRYRALKAAASRVLRSKLARLAVGVAYGKKGVPFKGTRIQTEGSMSYAGPMLLFGNYERAEIEFIARYLPTDLDVLEVGASIGATSCQIARKLSPGRRLTCVEANPNLMNVLRRNLASNAGNCSVEVVHALIGPEAGMAYFDIRTDSLASSATTSAECGVRVQCEPIAALASRFCPNDYSLISDVEGAEATFLGDPAALARCRFMVIEAHSARVGRASLSVEDVLALPLQRKEWRIIDRYGAVAAYERTS